VLIKFRLLETQAQTWSQLRACPVSDTLFRRRFRRFLARTSRGGPDAQQWARQLVVDMAPPRSAAKLQIDGNTQYGIQRVKPDTPRKKPPSIRRGLSH